MVVQNYKSGYSIKELPSERFYDWLNSNLISATNYYSDCNTLNERYKRTYENKRLCARVAKYIKIKPSISNEKHLKDHHCNLLSYWIYEQLVSYYGDNSNETFHVFADILRVLSGLKYYLNNNKCELNSSIPIIPDRQEKKELYKYCIDYKTILEKSKHRKDQCNEYYKYVQKKILLYKKYETFCSSSDKRNCPDFYENCKKNDPKVLLDQLKCKDEMLNEKQKPEDSPGTDSLGTTSSSFPRIQSVSNLGNAFLGVVVTSMTSGFLYKFTPLGTRIRNGLLWNNNNISNLNTNSDELFVQESYSPYAGEEQHLIGYHPS
ncbi:Plasmodium vivax Vir protein, putative [Plasmodium vivax]|uniref:Vir protein, putative n=1 Tax=Plasmodium vivax TaxID=5855 RepID=A0A1G4EEG7_PLAVI|nr:Plasmodium vivax Vir protein, putative [Plasmodium vivax]